MRLRACAAAPGSPGGAAGANAARARADDGDFVSLKAKHNFSMAHLGMVLGMLRHSLVELQVQHCNDFFAVGGGALSAVACLPRLRVLRIEDLHCRTDRDSLAELAQLRGVRLPVVWCFVGVKRIAKGTVYVKAPVRSSVGSGKAGMQARSAEAACGINGRTRRHTCSFFLATRAWHTCRPADQMWKAQH